MHVPVLKEEVLEALSLCQGKRVLDGTIGYGGHAREILERIGPTGVLVGIDQDREAVEGARANLACFHNSFIEKANFSELDRVLSQHSIGKADAILFDLGVSLEQLRNPVRGFSFLGQGPLDMRMDLDSPVCAKDLLTKLSESEIAQLIWEGSQERNARRIAREIVRRRGRKALETTSELAELIASVTRGKRVRIHPATRTFQSLRIAVNHELDHLRVGLEKALAHLEKGGRIAVISFHSLEDRIVKQYFKERRAGGQIEIVTRKPIRPRREECQRNPRSRSAKLRVAERI